MSLFKHFVKYNFSSSDGHVTLTLTTVDISPRNVPGMSQTQICDMNKLTMFDGSDENATMIGVYCGTAIPLPIITQGNVLFMKLSSMWGYQGYFRATYSSASSACGGDIYSEGGSFATPNYPRSYPPDVECVWTLRSSPGINCLLPNPA